MGKKNLIGLSLFIFSSIYSQVGIGIPNPTSTLDVNGDLRVRKLTAGSSTDAVIVTDADGNIKKVGRDSFGSGVGGGNSNDGSGFSSTILGYEPQPVANRMVPPFAPGGGTVTELGCKQWADNGHYYCAYQLSVGTNWFNSFLLGKTLGGYLVTLTSTVERNWVKSNLLDAGTGYDLVNNIWIGHNKIARPGNPTLFTWITGEEFVVNWATNPATVESFFASGEPNNAGGTEGSVHILSTNVSTDRRWNDLSGTLTTNSNGGKPFNQVIVEFNK